MKTSSSVSTMPLHLRRQPAALSQQTPDRHVLDDATASYVSNIMWVSCLLIDTGWMPEATARRLSGAGGNDVVGRLHPNWRVEMGSMWGVLGRQCEGTLAWHEVSRLPVELLSCFWALR
jgi:hypothetical protein